MEELEIPLKEFLPPDSANGRVAEKLRVPYADGIISTLAPRLKNKKSAVQFVKFLAVGGLNTVVDLGVLNFLVFAFGSSVEGYSFALFKSVSFVAAVSCSYICNRRFVFGAGSREKPRYERRKFFAVSAVGFMINVSMASFAFLSLTRAFGGHASLYYVTTTAALCGSAAGLFWNFFGYKKLVFKK